MCSDLLFTALACMVSKNQCPSGMQFSLRWPTLGGICASRTVSRHREVQPMTRDARNSLGKPANSRHWKVKHSGATPLARLAHQTPERKRRPPEIGHGQKI